MNIGEEISDEGEVVSDISEIKEGEIIAGDQQNVMENEYNLEFVEVKSGRGRSLLSRLGFEYYFENESRTMEGVEYWRCVKRSNGYCTGRIHVLAEWRQLNEIRYKLGKIANAAHNHPADPEKQSIRDAIEKLKNLAGMENPLITREAVDQSRATINMAARANAPSTSAMSRTYQRAKRRTQEELGDRGLDRGLELGDRGPSVSAHCFLSTCAPLIIFFKNNTSLCNCLLC
uniref:FLYWCH-type domain-containing protein n=1 Tax=Meloidogyne enterolobii TaxID=390850 RepID=A0A6V7VV79_MELEN|nr:unnamed protein product [Meloidogyne enterolobii]